VGMGRVLPSIEEERHRSDKWGWQGGFPVVVSPGAPTPTMVRETALVVAARDGNVEEVTKILEERKGKDGDGEEERGELDIAMAAACCNGHARLLRHLHEAGADLEFTDDTEFTPLLWAVEHSQVECVREMLRMGANPNARSYTKGTPLILACELRKTEEDLAIVRALLDAKADVDHVDGQAASATMWSITQGSLVLLRTLLQAKPNLDLVDSDGQTALVLAVQSSNPDKEEMVKALVDAGADANVQDRQGNTALMLAVDRSNETMASVLLGVDGVDILLKNEDGETAMDIAQEKVEEGKDVKAAQKILDKLRGHAENHPPPAKKAKA